MPAKTVINANFGTDTLLVGAAARRLTTPIAEVGVDELYQSLVDRMAQMVFRKDLSGRFVFANQRFCDWLGRGRGDIMGKTDHDLFPEDLAVRLAVDDRRSLESGCETSNSYEFPSNLIATEIRRIPIRDARGTVVGLHGLVGASVPVLDPRTLLLGRLLEAIPENIYFKDADGRFTHMSQQMATWLGLANPDQAIGRTAFEFFSTDYAARWRDDDEQIRRSGVPLVDVSEKAQFPDGRTRWVSLTKLPLRDSNGQVVGTFGICRDVTEQKRIEEQLARQGFYDSLTNLPNRALFANRIEHLFRRAVRHNERGFLFAVLYFDVDRFKGINDSFGHDAGDELLVQIARRLERSLRPSDTLARLGGDDFAILLEDLRSTTDATRVAERIHQHLVAPFSVAGTEVFCSASIGIALSTSGYGLAHEMLRDANTAMYRAKANGRSCHEIFDVDMHRRAVSQLKIETDMRRALERQEFRVHYQPIVDLERRQLSGFEALLRWQHPKRGLVPPGEFIPVAEETGLIKTIGLWVLHESCRQMREWQDRHPSAMTMRMSVNLSGHQLAQPDLVEQIERTLELTGIDPRALAVEITESALVRDMSMGALVLEQLRRLQIQLNIDDFGTGYSSLSYLQNLPVDTLKIDRSFVRGMKADGGRSEIVHAIITLAHSLKMRVVGEGVETREQLDALTGLHCNGAQGFFFAQPLPPEEAERLIATGLPPF
jgi:diguanylate cyclase (GGDEF)-like protein/PAS domain S-box-containing protein